MSGKGFYLKPCVTKQTFNARKAITAYEVSAMKIKKKKKALVLSLHMVAYKREMIRL